MTDVQSSATAPVGRVLDGGEVDITAKDFNNTHVTYDTAASRTMGIVSRELGAQKLEDHHALCFYDSALIQRAKRTLACCCIEGPRQRY